MAKNNNKKKNIYRLVIIDDKTLETKFSVILTKLNVLSYTGSIIAVVGLLVALLFIFTPLKYILPPVDNIVLQNQLLKNSVMIDSLKKELEFRDHYFMQIQNILTDSNINVFQTTDTNKIKLLTKEQQDSIMRNLIKRENENLKQLIADNNVVDIATENFFTPVSGVVSNHFAPAKSHYGCDIVAPEGTPVVSVLPGTVILANWSVNSGYTIAIQHSNNFISVYKHNSELLKKQGDRVKAGEAIALVGNTGEQTTGPHLHFELWQNGIPVDPEKYIKF